MRNPIAKFLEPGQSLLELHPQILAVQEDIVKAKSAAEVLILSDANRGKLASLHAGTALHRATALALKKGSKTHSELVKADHRFTALIEDVGQLVVNHQLGSVALSHVLWSLVRFDLACTVAWFPRLIFFCCRRGHLRHERSVPRQQGDLGLLCAEEGRKDGRHSRISGRAADGRSQVKTRHCPY
jgi:hypothetical protein